MQTFHVVRDIKQLKIRIATGGIAMVPILQVVELHKLALDLMEV